MNAEVRVGRLREGEFATGWYLRQQSRGVEVDLIHALSTIRPSRDRDTQGRPLPVGNWAGSHPAAPASVEVM